MAATGLATIGELAGTNGIALAHSANLTAIAACSDGTAADSNPEASLQFTHFGDQVGNTVISSVNGTVIDSHLVTAEQPDFNVNVQSGAGHIVVKAVWPGNTPTFSFDIKKCEVPTTTTTVQTTTTTAAPETTTTAAETTTSVDVGEPATPIIPATTTMAPNIGEPVVATLPKTGVSHNRVEGSEKLGGGLLLAGVALVTLASRRHKSARA